jgi:hypothetical protein
MKLSLVRWWVAAMLLVTAAPAPAVEPIAARVSPATGVAPADLLIQAFIEPDDRNRFVEFEVDSEAFYASSMAPLEGAEAPRAREVRFRMLPSGLYTIRIALIGTTGRRAAIALQVELR